MLPVFLLLGVASALRLPSLGEKGSKSSKAVTDLIIVRTKNTSPGAMERIHKFAEDIKTNLPTAHFLVSVDETPMIKETSPKTFTHLKSMEKATLNLPEINTHSYELEGLTLSYPALREARRVLARNSNQWDEQYKTQINEMERRNPPIKFFTIEPTLAALEDIQKRVSITDETKVWKIEDDVFICGNLSSFISKYMDDKSDFLGTGEYHFENEKKRDAYRLKNVATDAFIKKYDARHRRVENEIFQRFSVKYLKHLGTLIQDKKMTAVEEIFAPTVCINDPSICKWGQFAAKDVGQFKWNLHYTSKEQTDQVCRNSTEVTINHAAKY